MLKRRFRYTQPRELRDRWLDVQDEWMDYLAQATEAGDFGLILALELMREDQRHSQQCIEAATKRRRAA